MERKVILRLDGVEMSDLLIKAIGYLVLWAFTGYNELLIGKENQEVKNPNLIAYYTNTENKTMYTIGAIFDKKDNTYSFHS